MKYIKKPIEVDAFQWTGGPDQREDPAWMRDAIEDRTVVITTKLTSKERMKREKLPFIQIRTPEGVMTAYPGDYIIKGIEGEIYPCKESVFKKSYKRLDKNGYTIE